MHNIVWSITNSDCTSKSGLQADLLTISALASEACSVVTAITSDNQADSIPIEVFTKQLDVLAESKPAQVIKIGFLANIEQVQVLAKKITEYKKNTDQIPYVIYDPTAIVESERELLEAGIIEVIKSDLLPVVDLVTPNAIEVITLAGHALISGESFKPAALKLISMGCKSVLIKGGHIALLEDSVLDYWTDGQREIALENKRLTTLPGLSLGGNLTSALAAAIAQGYVIEDAFVVAKAYLNQRLKAPQNYLCGGWPSNPADFPQVVFPESKAGYEFDLPGSLEAGAIFARCDTTKLGLYPVLDSIEWLETVLKLGVKTVQLRIKDKADDQVEQQVIDAIALGREYNARLFINDYWQLAIKHQAYGVHLGQEDMQLADLHQIADAGLHLGLSTHGYYELLSAKQLKPSYIALGHIFPTQTKDMPSAPQGLIRLKQYVNLLEGMPGVAIGGISLQRAAAVHATGVGSIAVVSAITQADDPQKAIDAFNRIIAKE